MQRWLEVSNPLNRPYQHCHVRTQKIEIENREGLDTTLFFCRDKTSFLKHVFEGPSSPVNAPACLGNGWVKTRILAKRNGFKLISRRNCGGPSLGEGKGASTYAAGKGNGLALRGARDITHVWRATVLVFRWFSAGAKVARIVRIPCPHRE